MHDDALQLQFALGAMIAGFTMHHIYLPFDTSKLVAGLHFLDEDKEGHYAGQGILLHHLERNSIIVCSLLLWSASVFTMRVDCGGIVWGFCSLVVLVVFLSNVIFLASGVYYFVRFFLKRTKLVEHVMKSKVMTEIRKRTPSFDVKSVLKARTRRSTVENPIADLNLHDILSGNVLKSASGGTETKANRGRGGRKKGGRRGRSCSSERPERLPGAQLEMSALGDSIDDYGM